MPAPGGAANTRRLAPVSASPTALRTSSIGSLVAPGITKAYRPAGAVCKRAQALIFFFAFFFGFALAFGLSRLFSLALGSSFFFDFFFDFVD